MSDRLTTALYPNYDLGISEDRVKKEEQAFENAEEEFKEDLIRDFDVKEFLGGKYTKGKYKSMKEFRNDHKELYEEEQNNPKYKFDDKGNDPEIVD